ncbi:Rieske 2Fe-2S domain-containing protein [Roseomonas chloroacetimidivorans]|uniref:Rieske 2Fe-2S domain-containing protein n=1 Tax=Roseomonas chloroacetimidivorans TaxID=1766656 RepID=UPI003C72655E
MKIADLPVFRRFWYPISSQARLAGAPQAFSLFQQDMVVWQGSDGVVSALADRCGHEAVRLSPGEVCGNRLVCPHHHWEFDAGGHCVRIPQRPALVPGPRAHVRPYFAVGLYGLAWVATEKPMVPVPKVPELGLAHFRVVQTLHERWRVSIFRLADSSLDLMRDSQLAGAEIRSVEDLGFGQVVRFVLPGGNGPVSGSVSWWAPATRVLRLSYASGLERVMLTAAAPLADRWSVVSRLEARNDREVDVPEKDIVALDRRVAAEERANLEALPPDVPIMSGEGAELLASDPRHLPRLTLRRIVETSEAGASSTR